MSHRPHFHQLPGPAYFPLMFTKGHVIIKGKSKGYNQPRMQEKEWQKRLNSLKEGRYCTHSTGRRQGKGPPGSALPGAGTPYRGQTLVFLHCSTLSM